VSENECVNLDTECAGVLTIHATHRDLLLTGYAHVQTHRFFLFCFVFLQKVHFPVIISL